MARSRSGPVADPATTAPDSYPRRLASAMFSTLPVELILHISCQLTQKDRSHLARTCHGLAKVLTHEIFVHDAIHGDHHALWHACQFDDTTLLKRFFHHNQSSDSANLAELLFQKNHAAPRWNSFASAVTSGFRPLVVAIRAGSHRVVEALLNAGAQVIYPDAPSTSVSAEYPRFPINWVADLIWISKPKTIRKIIGLLAKHGADLDATPETEELWKHMLPGQSGVWPSLILESVSLQHFPAIRNKKSANESTAESYDDELQLVLSNRLTILECLYPQLQPSPHHKLENIIFELLANLSKWEPRFNFPSRFTTKQERKRQREMIHKHVLCLLRVLLTSQLGLLSQFGHFSTSAPYFRSVQMPSPLHWIATTHPTHHMELISLFLLHGCHVDTISPTWQTPLFAFCSNIFQCSIFEKSSSAQAIELLLEKGADVNHWDNNGQTALHVACSSRTHISSREDAVRLLVRAGTDLGARDFSGLTARDIARREELDGIVKILDQGYRKQRRERQQEKLKDKKSHVATAVKGSPARQKEEKPPAGSKIGGKFDGETTAYKPWRTKGRNKGNGKGKDNENPNLLPDSASKLNKAPARVENAMLVPVEEW
ncbi:ankyrin repeat domain-containing protein 50 [Microdochium nivale]|nr:ankyrin repeat domain-containing protein 50 [Microdochium nivale]